MLNTIGFSSLEELIDATVPNSILKRDALALPEAATESEALAEMKAIARMNTPSKSLIGMGYYGTKLPSVIQRNMTENPDWYTSYTPYQAEISQGRLEMLLNFQTMVADLTGMEVSNASLLDEATAAAEAMTLAANATGKGKNRFFVAEDTHPQVIDVILSRAKPMGINVQVGPLDTLDLAAGDVCGVLVQYPNTYGSLVPAGLHRTPEVDGLLGLAGAVHDAGALLVASADLMALTHVTPPGEWGADVVVGSAQRFGVPLGYGGPHAGFLATKEAHMRRMPGRVIGVSRDSAGNPALRMAMQTREQHIRRDKATSNICTAQALLANMAAAYGVYHGPAGLRSIAHGIHARTAALASLLRAAGHNVLPEDGTYFDTFTVAINPAVIPGAPAEGHAADIALQALSEAGFDARRVDDVTLGISLDEALSPEDVGRVAQALGAAEGACPKAAVLEAAEGATPLAGHLQRTSSFMTHPVFNTHHTESQMMRYLSYLAGKDVSLTRSMIALGSCTMKLNSAAEMAPVTWPEFTDVHPFVPVAKAAGYATMIQQLSQWLANVTGFQAVSMQPNSGAAGEYAGLLAIKQCLEQEGQGHRNICLIPASAHGTNPASAVMAGMKVVVVKNDPATGAIDNKDLDAKLAKHAGQVAAVMVTYPSTYGVYEDGVAELCQRIHDEGGLVYMDGANMNAQCGLTSPGHIGADVCHLNLHKTFCIPHGGGGPGVGAIGVNARLAPFLPGHSVVPTGGNATSSATPHGPDVSGLPAAAAGDGTHVMDVPVKNSGAVAAAPYGSSMILPITWMYLRMLGNEGLTRSTETAILSANYLAKRLESGYDILYRGPNGTVAHEFIVDLRPFKKAGIVEEDVAKRLADYGFHSPTMSWPVPGTLMIEPTESEDKAELDRFAEAMLSIRQEIQDVMDGTIAVQDSPLKHAPHTAQAVTADEWDRPYTRQQAVYPLPWVKDNKYWPTVGRVDNVYGDRNLQCSCPPLSLYEEVPER